MGADNGSIGKANVRHQFVSASDGLRLHVIRYGPPGMERTPLVCLPGLTRTADDFHPLATALASDPNRPRPVFALDYRGRGQSGYDADAANYNVATELGDVLAVITALGIGPAVYIGTSRGGILAMMLATVRPTAIAGVVLNDIGPVIESEGLARIKGYVGRLPQPRSFDEGADILRGLFGVQFPKLSHGDWIAFARRTFEETPDGSLKLRYDPKLASTVEAIDTKRPPSLLWNEFGALAAVPVMVIRGANSDILSTATVATMRARHPGIVTLEIPDQGHAPLLTESDVIARIAAFIDQCEARMTAR